MSLRYVLGRLLLAIPTLFGIAVFVFVLLRVVPGDPIAMMVAGEATPEDIAHLREAYGLDKSIPEQFLIYLREIVTGNFGTSISLKQDVMSLVLGRLPATLELAVFAIGLSIFLGIAFGLISVYFRRRWPELVIDSVNAIALALPEFLWGLILILLFSVVVPVLPISGRIDPLMAVDFHTDFYLLESLVTGHFAAAREILAHMILPAIALSLPLLAVIARVLKTSLLDAINQDFVMLARVKGFSSLYVLVRHALPNALIPTITVSGVHFIFLVGGTVLIELIFAYPGIGNMLFGAAINRDLPLLQGITLVFAVLFVFLNLLIDLSYALVNPRVRQS